MIETLYLVRHAKAEGSHPQGDRHRALSEEGRRRIEAMLPEADDRAFRVDLALSSPYLRAVQTRDLFAPVFGPARLETTTALTPDADPEELLEELKDWESQGFVRIAVFTHNPYVTLLAGLLMASGSGSEPAFHTPTILALGFGRGLEVRGGRPLWILNP